MTTEKNDPLVNQLDRRPEARSIRVEDLLADVMRGRVRIPPFQRGLKWQPDDARKLLDSIYRGYPIGTLLLWETKAEAQELRFGAVSVAAPARPDAWWVVDGQQRVVSLARVLLTTAPSSDDFALHFDLQEPKFVAGLSEKLRVADVSRWLPLTAVLDSELLIQWLLEQQPAAVRRELAIRVGKRIREYDVPAYIVRSDSEGTLREIFERSNNSGRRLEVAEVFDALHGARYGQHPASITDIVRDLESLHFGRVEQKILYRLLRVLSGADVTERGDEGVLRLSGDDARRAYTATATAARSVILFLKRDVGIAHYDLLPYKLPLVTLGKFFHHHPAPRARSRELLVRWLWRGALNGAHRGDTVSTRQALERIDATDEEGSVQRMLAMVSARPTERPSAMEPFNFRFAFGKLQTLALEALGPRDLDSGEALGIEALFEQRAPEEDVPLPDIVASEHDGAERTTANRMLHPKRPGLRRQLLAVREPAVLASHGVGEEARAALAAGDAKAFLSLRSATLNRHFDRFFAERARWDEPDRPSIQALTVLEED